MPEKIIGNYEIPYLQILDEHGNCDEKLKPKLMEDDMKKMYKLMILVRAFDIKAFALQRQGRIGTYAQTLGQEASQVGSAYALRKSDWLFPMYRSNGPLITAGVPMKMILLYWAGDERGQHFPGNVFPIDIEVGTQMLHAVGAGIAAKFRNDRIAMLTYFGDGATSKGDFHESMNFAGVFKSPCVMFCENNQFAISMRRKYQTAAETIAQKAVAYGFDGIQLDGNDIFAVYKATNDALDKARKGKGPTLIESFTYRMADHTTSDDASRYRKDEEVDEWKVKDPVDRLRKYLQKKGIWTKEFEEHAQKEAQKKVEAAVKSFESSPAPKPDDMFTNTFAKMPQHLKEQLESLKGGT